MDDMTSTPVTVTLMQKTIIVVDYKIMKWLCRLLMSDWRCNLNAVLGYVMLLLFPLLLAILYVLKD